MLLNNQTYEIEIAIDETYTLNSTDNKHYDYVYNPNKLGENDFINVFSIKIKSKGKSTGIALVGGLYSDIENCAILNENTLIVLQNEMISQIDITTGELLDSKIIETFGSNFAIYQIQTGYIIHGEIEILKLSFDFEIEWSFSGKDIFATIDGEKAFELCEDCIKLYDFENNYYEIDFDGKLICEKQAR